MKNKIFKNSYSTLTKLNNIFSKKEKQKITSLFVISFISALIQSVSVVSVMPFINMVMNMNSIKNSKMIRNIYEIGQFKSDRSFIMFVGIVVVILLILSSLFSSITSWQKNSFVLKRNASLSKRLICVYLNKPYDYFLNNNTSELSKNILSEVYNLGNLYISNLLELIISSLLFAFMLVTLFVVNPLVTLLVIVLFGSIYVVMTLLVRKQLVRSGELVVQFNNERFKNANEALSGVKITKSLGLENFFIKRFGKAADKFSHYQLFSRLIADIPNYILEGVIFSLIVVVVLIIVNLGYDVAALLPVIGVYALAGYRITPALNKVFKAITTILHNQPILDKVHHDLFLADQKYESVEEIDQIMIQKRDEQKITFQSEISFNQIHFSYLEDRPTLSDINFKIKKNEMIGFAGTTGSGKTTLIDLFLGLLEPTSGFMAVDDVPITDINLQSWRNIIGYVPQDIFLIDDTITKNIAFGLSDSEIDFDQVKRVAKIASIAEFIENELPLSYDTVVGERGVRLSGGQRQRIGLARALYRNPEILVLDEATSALDGTTEKIVVKAIQNESNVKTMLIIAHRLNTLKDCDNIYFLEKGVIMDSGSYDELIKNNPLFASMAKVAPNIA